MVGLVVVRKLKHLQSEMVDEFAKAKFTTNAPFFKRIVSVSKVKQDSDTYVWMSELDSQPSDAIFIIVDIRVV